MIKKTKEVNGSFLTELYRTVSIARVLHKHNLPSKHIQTLSYYLQDNVVLDNIIVLCDLVELLNSTKDHLNPNGEINLSLFCLETISTINLWNIMVNENGRFSDILGDKLLHHSTHEDVISDRNFKYSSNGEYRVSKYYFYSRSLDHLIDEMKLKHKEQAEDILLDKFCCFESTFYPYSTPPLYDSYIIDNTSTYDCNNSNIHSNGDEYKYKVCFKYITGFDECLEEVDADIYLSSFKELILFYSTLQND